MESSPANLAKDLISYIFESTDPFVVKECVKGDGELPDFITFTCELSNQLGCWVVIR